MKEPIDIRTRKPIEDRPGEARKPHELTTSREPVDRRALAASHLDAQFAETERRIRADLSRLQPETIVSALSPESREEAVSLIAEARAWIDRFEQALKGGGTLRAV